MSEPPVDLSQLDLAQLALFVGTSANELLTKQLHAEGFESLRPSHGYVVQHLLRAPHSATELARLLGVSQQAVSKTIAELVHLGYLQYAAHADARFRSVELSARGRAAVDATRRLRRELDQKLRRAAGAAGFEQARAALLAALQRLDVNDSIRSRRASPPR